MDDETSDFLRDLFNRLDDAPADVVPPSGMTRQDYINQNDATGKTVTVTIPGEVIYDVDGSPIGVEPPQVSEATFAGACVTRAQLAAVGLTPEDVPNLTVLTSPKENHR